MDRSWLWAFLFTQLVEVPIYMLGPKLRFDEAFCASAFTHPIVWFVIPDAFGWLYFNLLAPHPSLQLSQAAHYWTMVVVCETFAVGVEAGYLWWLKKESPLRWSIVANMSSVALGLFSRSCFNFP